MSDKKGNIYHILKKNHNIAPQYLTLNPLPADFRT